MGYQNILLIEDDDDDQEIFLKAIGELSDSVSCVALWDAPQALLKLTKNEIKPDVIFLDLNMPVMNGQQFLKELKKNDALKKHSSYYLFHFCKSGYKGTYERTGST